MPSEEQRNTRSYLLQVLINGDKAFRYRSGIRTLLGLPDSSEAELSYPLPLPPSGFRYLQSLSHDELNGDSPAKPFAEFSPEVTRSGQQNRYPAQPTPKEPLEEGVQERPSGPANAGQPDSLLQPIYPAGSPGKITARTGKIREQVNQGTGPGKSERMQIDIPGSSEEAQRFTALEPRKEKTTLSETARPVERQEEMVQPRVLTLDPAISSPTASAPPTAAVLQNAVQRSRAPHAESDFGRRIDPVPRLSTPDFETVRQATAPEIEIAPRPAQHSRPDASATRVAEPTPSTAVPGGRGQQAAEARIGQLRHALETAKRQSIAEATPAGDTVKPGAAEDGRPAGAPAKPVVIVRTAPIKRRSPAAFWERSHLGRLYRVRPLR